MVLNTKKSYGLGCFKKEDNEWKILLVKKRVTYSYISFILSKIPIHKLRYNLNKMTIDEKLDILSGSYEQMYFRAFLNSQTSSKKFIRLKKSFKEKYLSDDGVFLKSLITSSTNGELLWEIPKGKIRYGETVNECILREFNEEARLKIINSNISQHFKYNYSYIEDNVNYNISYKIAVCSKDLKLNQIIQSEISEIKWVPIKFIDAYNTHNLKVIVKTMINYIKKHYIKQHNYWAYK
jgi:ADP-ribose pyrophosphatase YjhB (NUDIX family)